VRKVRHVGAGGPSRRPKYFATVVCDTSMPSFRSSPWIRGEPQRGLAACTCRISARMSTDTPGRLAEGLLPASRTVEVANRDIEARTPAAILAPKLDRNGLQRKAFMCLTRSAGPAIFSVCTPFGIQTRCLILDTGGGIRAGCRLPNCTRPLANIGNLRTAQIVVQGGRVVKR